MIDRAIDRGLRKLDQQRGRQRGERSPHSRGGHADRAQIVGLIIGRMVLAPIAIQRSDRCDQLAGSLRAIKSVGVTEGQRKVYGHRDEREP